MPCERSELESSYYPPRAGHFAAAGRGWRRVSVACRRFTPEPAESVPAGQALLALLAPGVGFGVFGRRLAGLVVAVAWGLAVLLAFYWLATPAVQMGGHQFDPAFMAAGAAAGLHATSAGFFAQLWWGWTTFVRRIVMSVAVTGLLLLCLYLPLGTWVRAHVAQPVRLGARAWVVNPSARPAEVRRGEWVLWNQPQIIHGNIRVAAGLRVGPVVALSGERVEFGPEVIRINGVPQPRRPGMPQAGSLVVPPACWLAWPEDTVQGNFNPGPEAIAAVKLNAAVVPWLNFTGKARERWFFRRNPL